MGPTDSTPAGRSVFHGISETGLRGLVRGGGDGDVIEELLSAERSRRLLLLRALLDRSAEQASGHDGERPLSVQDAWDLLERAQARAPGAVDGVLMAPGTGTWLSSALRLLRGAPQGEDSVRRTLGHLSALAVAGAAGARIRFALWVPASEGIVSLPGLGCAVLPGAGGRTAVRVTGDGERLRISGPDGDVVVGPEWGRRAPGWRPTRRLTLGRGDAAGSLALEEHDPFRTFSGPTTPSALSDQEAAAWQSAVDEAWDLLCDEPDQTEAMRRGLRSITPVPRGERFRPYSSSSAEAFGAVNASLPDEGAELAATLVHEFQHIKLGALTHLGPLVTRSDKTDEPPRLFHAPWRDDPRPLEGLLQGIYAFFGVTRFWRAHRHAADPAHEPLAHFEFALWRDAVWSTLDDARGHERLTALGNRLLESLARICAGWLTERLPAEELRLAREAAASHRARWREHHLRPAADVVDEAVRAWRRGESCPPSLRTAPSSLRPDPDACFLDTAAVLARHRLTDPDGPWRDPGTAAVRGAGPVDVLLAGGAHSDARRILTDQLMRDDPPVGSWAALGRATAEDPQRRAAARFLLGSPHWARAVRDTLAAEHGERPDPMALAAWLSRAGQRPRPTA
ncbi:HEXXH motif domain-containing protein [Streptomyces sp. NPDC046979]|uniref:HEXXH motif domain-containing protein n=1 Tax=Streptomyces sp. NPDC046979 TaxID=3154604 RepID=UPI003406BBAA